MTKRRTLQEQVVFHRPRRRHFAVTYRRLALRRASSRKPSCLISLDKVGEGPQTPQHGPYYIQHAAAGVESNMRLTDFSQFDILQSGLAAGIECNSIH
jgi:hypothetical protein